MFGLSFFEILFLAILALIVIGPKELPVVARTLGRFLNDLKRTTNGLTDELKQHARIDRIDLNEAPTKPVSPPKHTEHTEKPEAGFSTSQSEPHSPSEVHSPIEQAAVDNQTEVKHPKKENENI